MHINNKYYKLAVISAIIIEAVLIISALTGFIQHNRKNTGLYLLSIVCIALPFIITYIANKKKLLLPPSFNLISVIFLFSAMYLGEINNFYTRYPWWDLLLHAVFGSYAVTVSLHVIRGIIRREIEVSKNRFVMFSAIFAFSFSVALGTIWEAFEFSGDFLFKTGMVKGGLEDTSTDILINIAASLITSAYYYLKKRKSKCS